MLLVGNLSFLHGRMNLYNGFFAGSIATGDAGGRQKPREAAAGRLTGRDLGAALFCRYSIRARLCCKVFPLAPRPPLACGKETVERGLI